MNLKEKLSSLTSVPKKAVAFLGRLPGNLVRWLRRWGFLSYPVAISFVLLVAASLVIFLPTLQRGKYDDPLFRESI